MKKHNKFLTMLLMLAIAAGMSFSAFGQNIAPNPVVSYVTAGTGSGNNTPVDVTVKFDFQLYGASAPPFTPYTETQTLSFIGSGSGNTTTVASTPMNVGCYTVVINVTATVSGPSGSYGVTGVSGVVLSSVENTAAHTCTNWTVSSPATCVMAAVESGTCDGCGVAMTQSISGPDTVNGHNWDAGTVAPGDEATCSAKGWTTYTCSNVGCVMSPNRVEDIDIDPAAHDWDTGTVTDPTCMFEGYTTYICLLCNDTDDRDITAKDPNNHVDQSTGINYATYTTPKEAATCTEDGEEYERCWVCSAVLNTLPILAHGHYTDNDWHNGYALVGGEYTYTRPGTFEPTCNDGGEADWYCDICDEVHPSDHAPVAKLGHDYVDTVTQATCTEEGVITHTCSRCSAFYTTPIPRLPHDYNAGDYTYRTCTVDGYTTFTCQSCGGSYDVIDTDTHTGHTWLEKDPATAATTPATCTVDGSIQYYCTNPHCDVAGGEPLEIDVIPHTGHTWDDPLVKVTKKATCTELGSYELYCTNPHCDVADGLLGTHAIIPKDHEWDWQNDEKVEPTCGYPGEGTDGWWKVKCKQGGDDYYEECEFFNTWKEWQTFPALVHDFGGNYHTRATCTEHGIDHQFCMNPGCGYEYDNIIAPLEHAFEGWYTVKPTCEGIGYDVLICNRINENTGEKCGELHYENYVPAIGHFNLVDTRITYGAHDNGEDMPGKLAFAWVYFEFDLLNDDGVTTLTKGIAPDYIVAKTRNFTTSGEDTLTLADVGCCYLVEVKVFVTVDGYRNITDVSLLSSKQVECNHEWDDALTVDPTCTELGSQTCKFCGKTEPIEPLGHIYAGVWSKDQTCTEDGEITSTCTRCGDVQVDPVPMLGHDWDYANGQSTATTCESDGFMTYTCLRCGETMEDRKPEWAAFGHDYVAVVTPANCEEDGYTTYTCSRPGCGDTYVDDIVLSPGHDWKTTFSSPATCGWDAYVIDTCQRCGEFVKIVDEGSALEHEWEEDFATPAWCGVNGSTTYKCGHGCGETKVVENAGSALDHDWNSGVPTTLADCIHDGVLTITCQRCGETKTEVIPATGVHNYDSEVTTPATCLDDGVRTYTCPVCGDTYTDDIPATGHDWSGAWEDSKAADVGTNAEVTKTCGNNCGKTKTREVPDTYEEPDFGKWDAALKATNDLYTEILTRQGNYQYATTSSWAEMLGKLVLLRNDLNVLKTSVAGGGKDSSKGDGVTNARQMTQPEFDAEDCIDKNAAKLQAIRNLADFDI